MEKSVKGRQGTEPDDSHDVQIAMMDDDQLVREMKEWTKNETLEGLKVSGSANYASGQILHPQVEQRGESMQNVSEELSGSTRIDHDRVVGECQKERIQAPIEMADDEATKQLSEPSKTRYGISIGNIVERVMDNTPDVVNTRSRCHDELAAWMEKDQNVPESDEDMEELQLCIEDMDIY